MYAQIAAVGQITEFLTGLGLKHFVIGGIPNAIWGQPRATLDADFKVIIGHRSISEVVTMLGNRFQFRVAHPVASPKTPTWCPFKPAIKSQWT